jgi:hypothetical protein
MSLNEILELEDAYDQMSQKDFALWLRSQKKWDWMEGMLLAHYARNWKQAEQEARKVSLEGKTPAEAACFLQFAVSACDLRYSMEDRARWMGVWHTIEAWSSDPYAQIVRGFQEGVGFFFAGSLREASACFEMTVSLAERFNYDRGNIRSLLHLGLIARDRGASGEAAVMLERALSLAIPQKRVALITRIQVVLQELQLSDALETLFLENQFKEARERLLREEAQRRARGLLRKRQSLYIYLPLLALWRKNSARASLQIARIQDPILKVRVLRLKHAIFGAAPAEVAELDLLLSIHGIARASKYEVCGIRVDSLPTEDQRNLFTLLVDAALSNSGAIDKASIVQKIWRVDYDPVKHDGRAYKLIHALKKSLKIEDLILNRYGSYEINPIYLGQQRRSA